MSESSPPLLDPVLVARMSEWDLRSRSPAEGTLPGRHRGRRRGRAMEFSGHRPYTPSDDARRIDWRAYARTDRFVIREEEEETNRHVFLLVDASASMGYRGGGAVPKLSAAARLLAAIAYGLIRQGECVGAGIFSDRLRDHVPPRSGLGHLPLLLDLLGRLRAEGLTHPRGIDQAGELLTRRSWIILASDLWSSGEDLLPAVRRLRARRHEVSLICPSDPHESDLDLEGDFLFRDLEGGESLRTSPADIRDRYKKLAAERWGRLSSTFASLRIPLVAAPTHRPLEESLKRFLEVSR